MGTVWSEGDIATISISLSNYAVAPSLAQGLDRASQWCDSEDYMLCINGSIFLLIWTLVEFLISFQPIYVKRDTKTKERSIDQSIDWFI